MSLYRTYPSKIMLTGEYGVVAGGSALTIPFHRFRATVRSTAGIPDEKRREAALSSRYLRILFDHVSKLPPGAFHAAPDLDQFAGHLKRIWIDSAIPDRYGLGSSGAVSAAVYDLFFPGAGALPLNLQKRDLATIESCFHGKSSGVDALTCHAGKPLYFRQDGSIRPVNFNPAEIPFGYRFFLLDSGEKLDTGPLVNHFLDRMKEHEFASFIRNEYLAVNQKLIEALLGEREADPGLLVRIVSDYQFKHFRKMIPDRMVDLWIEGQVSSEFYLKLNGSGGGFLLGITHHTAKQTLDDRWNKELIWIE